MNVFSDIWAFYFHGGVIVSFLAIVLQLRIYGALNDEP
jgi:hypothetical protein